MAVKKPKGIVGYALGLLGVGILFFVIGYSFRSGRLAVDKETPTPKV